MKIFNIISVCLLCFLFSCKNSSQFTSKKNQDILLDTAEVVYNNAPFEREPYNPSYHRKNDLIHTKLEVSFDWKKKHLLGKATLRLKPLFYATDSLRLDAKGFDIQKLTLKNNEAEIPLQFSYTDKKNLYIKLNRLYSRKEEYTIYIEYVAKPDELPLGGSAAITADKGLYFINPLGEDPNKPMQIWTQGETESSSCWFPTIDRPNERTTQEIYIRVENRFKTLSNGLLISSTQNADGTITDYWKMDLPHAPYLFMMAVGEFAVVREEWQGKLLEYYVEPAFEKDAKNIFPFTGEMLSFFSEKFGYNYPWQKYAQVVVRDYVSGAMENTTAVIFGDFVQNDSRSLLDNSDMNEGIVAHEMMHHWFGDLVTCESWSNLPLNESFANYSEYLWFEHKYSKDHADYIRMNEIQGYLNQAVLQNDPQPLIRFNFQDKEDMFDAHSYNKGGTILHMLRNYVGDDAYFASLELYLKKNQYKSAEVHDLRLAFEETTGEDLNWFFNQWFLTKGHPKLQIIKKYDPKNKKVTIELDQLQDFNESTIFILPIPVDVYTEEQSKPERHLIWMKEKSQSFTLQCKGTPVWAAVDADRSILCERIEEQSDDENLLQMRFGDSFEERYEAIQSLATIENPAVKPLLTKALSDKFWVIRSAAIDAIAIDKSKDTEILDIIVSLAKNDPRPDVRTAAIDKLSKLSDKRYLQLFKEIMAKDQSYNVLNTTLIALSVLDQASALEMATTMEKESQPTLLAAIAELYAATKDQKYLSFFESNWSKMSDYSGIRFFQLYTELLSSTQSQSLITEKVNQLKNIGTDQKTNVWHRFGIANSLKAMRNEFKNQPLYNIISDAMNEIINKETNNMVKNIYKSW
jgi:aminopeptidase N